MKIEFIPYLDSAEKFYDPPIPAKKCIPDWFKKTEDIIEGEHTIGISNNNSSAPNTTMKKCVPFLDALTTGYMWCLPVDLEIRRNFQGKDYFFRWRTEGEFVNFHDQQQHPLLPEAINGEKFVMKWQFDYRIKTPKGYSTFFTHPLNRHDLPFRTFSGVVDTDEYIRPVQFPFQLLKFEGERMILEKGTPLCQFFPFARNNWESEKGQYSEELKRRTRFEFVSKIVSAYKSRYWTKKNYN
jgi:hypothetical protein